MADEFDEYNIFDFSEFTEDDFKQIDAEVTKKLLGKSQLVVEIESPKCQSNPSPAQKYRPSGIFSVTDLSSLSWCEVQFDYGLRQRRSEPLATRPGSFTSAQGKEIVVQKAVAAKNNQTTKRGKAAHKVLERQVRPEEIHVEVNSPEQRWALRLINMLACLQAVRFEGITREMPIIGIVHDEVIVGIIDEVARQQTGRAAHSKMDDSDTSLSQEARACCDTSCNTDNFSSPNQVTPIASRKCVIRVVDTKTRRTNSLPLHENTISSRIQLMLYRRLLNNLLSLDPPFDFSSLWARLQLDPSAHLSEKFLEEAGLIAESQPMYCLNDLAAAWMEYVSEPDIPAVDPVVEIIYRKQPEKYCRIHRKREQEDEVVNQEDLDLAKAVKASLQQVTPYRLDELSITDDEDNESVATVLDQSPSDPLPQIEHNGGFDKVPPAYDSIASDDTQIIGRKQFLCDETFLDDYLSTALEWWHGRRSPRGVSVQNAYRCCSCEYINGCEWREQKALEHRSQIKGKDTS